ncbi:MAG: hypothetical protein ACYTEQ_28115 [Planctomycetota bacterium]|jgi:hypothetical protein
MAESKSVVKVEEFKIAKSNPDRIGMLFRQAAGETGINPITDLQQVRIPAGGGTAWSVPTLQGESMLKEITGLIVHHHAARSYWPMGIDESGGQSPPQCVSHDGIAGLGIPGGTCNVCPLAQFGSDRRGRGQACKQMTWMYILQESSLMPLLVSIPSTGIKAARQYILALAGNGLAPYEAVTSIGLERTKNADGVQYSRPTFRFVEEIPEKMQAVVEEYAYALREYLIARTKGQVDTPIAAAMNSVSNMVAIPDDETPPLTEEELASLDEHIEDSDNDVPF